MKSNQFALSTCRCCCTERPVWIGTTCDFNSVAMFANIHVLQRLRDLSLILTTSAVTYTTFLPKKYLNFTTNFK